MARSVYRHIGPRGPVRPLTRQRERVVAGILRGLTYREIGGSMGGIRVDTVKGHVAAILNILPNPDQLPPRDCIFRWGLWRAWDRNAAAIIDELEEI